MTVPVLRGKYGWLFLDNDTNGVLAQMDGTILFKEDALKELCALHEKRTSWCKERGIAYYCLLAPEKHPTYPELLPDGVHVADFRLTTQTVEFFRRYSSVEMIYPLAEVKALKPEAAVFAWDDTHWHHRGAYAAVRILTERINRDIPIPLLDRDRITFGEGDREGILPYCGYRPHDLQNKFQPGYFGRLHYQVIRNQQGRLVHDNDVLYTGKKLVFENSRKDLPRAVMFRDSCADFMIAQLAESFSRLTVFWQGNLDFFEIEEERADLVIFEQVERFLRFPTMDEGSPSAREREAKKKR